VVRGRIRTSNSTQRQKTTATTVNEKPSNKGEQQMKIIMRHDLAEEGLRIPANNNQNYYDNEQVENMEFVYCVDELGAKDQDGDFYAMKTVEGELVHLYSIDLDFIQ
jgi:hypothetical protein